MKNIEIIKLDNQGRGISYTDNKITFIKKALPKDIVDIKIIKEYKKYKEAQIIVIKEKSPLRKKPPCPYFNLCGGCNFLNLSYEETLNYKEEKLQNIIRKYGNIEKKVKVNPSKNCLSYRNKITLKIRRKEIGYYEEDTHTLLKIENCLLAEEPIQKIIKEIKYLNIEEGEVVIRSNYNQELLLWIKTNKKVNPDIAYLREHHKIVGIVLNDTCIFGEPYLIERINKQIFKVSYDSFFQINRYICEQIFNKINNNIEDSEVLLDLYCGVGTLGINASKKANKVYGIEIVKNAIINAIENASINKRETNFYLLGDVGKSLAKIKDKIDTIIVDPPRAGLDRKTKEKIKEYHPKKIIYVSCEPMTLARDLKDLSALYDILTIEGYDMFPFTHHVECVCVLNRQ